jgi:hypothetical protein
MTPESIIPSNISSSSSNNINNDKVSGSDAAHHKSITVSATHSMNTNKWIFITLIQCVGFAASAAFLSLSVVSAINDSNTPI